MLCRGERLRKRTGGGGWGGKGCSLTTRGVRGLRWMSCDLEVSSALNGRAETQSGGREGVCTGPGGRDIRNNTEKRKGGENKDKTAGWGIKKN